MKKIVLILVLLAVLGLLSACEMLTTDNEVDNPNSDVGSYVWLNNRLNEEQEANDFEGQFGREFSSDSNDARPDAMQTDPSFPGLNQ